MIYAKTNTRLPPLQDTSDLTQVSRETPDMGPIQAVLSLLLTTSQHPSTTHQFTVPIDSRAKQATARDTAIRPIRYIPRPPITTNRNEADAMNIE